MRISDKAYDILKWLGLIVFDAVGTCYSALAAIWGLPYGDQIAQTCSAAALLIGALIGISCASGPAKRRGAENENKK